MRRLYYTGFAALLVLSFITFPLDASPARPFLVTQALDGDSVTIKVKSFAGVPLKTERVRLIGIDAPELKQEPWGRRAKRYLKKLLTETDWIVQIEFDAEERDQYGRLLAYLWAKDGRMVNERMIEDGYAVLYTLPPNVKYTERFIAAQKRAQSRKAGIWGDKGLKELPRQWREEHPRQ